MVAISRSDNLQEAKRRLDAAVDALESLLKHHLDDDHDGDSLWSLRERVRVLTDERDQLRKELDVWKTRTRRLESANDEVSGRLKVLMTTLQGNVPSVYR